MTARTRGDASATAFTRRDFLQSGGALIVSFAASTVVDPRLFAQGRAAGTAGQIDARQLDSWLAIASDGTVTAYTGKCDFGQGMFTAQLQLVAEELSVPAVARTPDSVRHVGDARSRHHLRQPVIADELQRAQPGPGRSDSAGGVAAAGLRSARRPSRSADRR